jgi:hypothetical protein
MAEKLLEEAKNQISKTKALFPRLVELQKELFEMDPKSFDEYKEKIREVTDFMNQYSRSQRTVIRYGEKSPDLNLLRDRILKPKQNM